MKSEFPCRLLKKHQLRKTKNFTKSQPFLLLSMSPDHKFYRSVQHIFIFFQLNFEIRQPFLACAMPMLTSQRRCCKLLVYHNQRSHQWRGWSATFLVLRGATLILSTFEEHHLWYSGEEASSCKAFVVVSLVNASHSSFEYFLLSGVVWKVEGNNHASEGGEGGEGGGSGISNLRRFFLGVFSDFPVDIDEGNVGRYWKAMTKLQNWKDIILHTRRRNLHLKIFFSIAETTNPNTIASVASRWSTELWKIKVAPRILMDQLTNWDVIISIDPSSVRTSLWTAQKPNHAPARKIKARRNIANWIKLKSKMVREM